MPTCQPTPEPRQDPTAEPKFSGFAALVVPLTAGLIVGGCGFGIAAAYAVWFYQLSFGGELHEEVCVSKTTPVCREKLNMRGYGEQGNEEKKEEGLSLNHAVTRSACHSRSIAILDTKPKIH